MARNGTAGPVVTSAQRAEGHEAMHEDEIPDVGITAGPGTFVADTGDVRGHRPVAKQNMSTGKTVMLEHQL